LTVNNHEESKMARTAQTIAFSVTHEIKVEVEQMAIDEGISKSQWFRDIVKAKRTEKRLRELERLRQIGKQYAEAAGVYTEEDVVRIVREHRQGR
jgi:hypothetical protein